MCVPYLREKRGERMGKWFTTQLVFIAGREERKRRRRREMLNNKNLKYLCNNYQLRVFAFLCEPELEDGRDGRSGEREREMRGIRFIKLYPSERASLIIIIIISHSCARIVFHFRLLFSLNSGLRPNQCIE